MSNLISITKVKDSKVDTLDFDSIALGRTFTDHMFVCDYRRWSMEKPSNHAYGIHSNASCMYGVALWTSVV